MANSRSALKRIKTTAVRTDRNRRIKSTVKTAIRRYNEVLAAGDKEKSSEALLHVQKILDKAVTKGVMHKNNVARKKSRLGKKLTSA